MFKSTNFDKMLEKATSNQKLDPDWPLIMHLCDSIRQGDTQPTYAMQAIKKKICNANPHTAMFALQVLESCVKNCGSPVHDEVCSKAYMESLHDLVKTTPHDQVKTKILELLQAWAFAFRNKPKYRAVQDTVNIMKSENYKFPPFKESDAMFSADSAPQWADGEVCHRCRVTFSLVQRKHHCRACGEVFCGQCSSRTSTLPKFGIEKEVRVCEACYDQVNKPKTPTTKPETELPAEYLSSSLSQQNQNPPPRKSEQELREEEELQLALALSKSEAEENEKLKKRTTSSLLSGGNRGRQQSPPPHANQVEPSNDHEDEDMDPELARYLNRALWEKRDTRSHAQQPSSNIIEQTPSAPSNSSGIIINLKENGEADEEIDEFVPTLRSQLEIFVNRMKSNSSRGRSIANDTSVQTLFLNITAMHSRLLRCIQKQDDQRVFYEGLQDCLTQVKDARAALDALRDEHKERLRREAEEAERARQVQMAKKLEIMRKKKQEYLQYQRQLALQRIQEQEREMHMRQEQQKQQYLFGYVNLGNYLPPNLPPNIPPNTFPGYGVGGIPPQPGSEGSPVHTGIPGNISNQPQVPQGNTMPGVPNAYPGPQFAPFPYMHPQNMGPPPGMLPPGMGPPPQQLQGPMPPPQAPPSQGPPNSMPSQVPGMPMGQGPHHPQQQDVPSNMGPSGPMTAPPAQPPPPPQQESQTAELISFD